MDHHKKVVCIAVADFLLPTLAMVCHWTLKLHKYFQKFFVSCHLISGGQYTHAILGSVKCLVMSKTMNVPKVTTLYECLREVIKHFGQGDTWLLQYQKWLDYYFLTTTTWLLLLDWKCITCKSLHNRHLKKNLHKSAWNLHICLHCLKMSTKEVPIFHESSQWLTYFWQILQSHTFWELQKTRYISSEYWQ